MIKTSTHTTKFSNVGKINYIDSLLRECTSVLQWYVTYIWKEYVLTDTQLPKFISTKGLALPENNLSSRLHKCLSTQAIGIVKAACIKNQQRKYINKKLNKNIELSKMSCPQLGEIHPIELNSICVEYIKSTSSFDGFIHLKSLNPKGNKNPKYPKKGIFVPIRMHKHANILKDMSSTGMPQTSFLINPKSIDIRWDLPEKPVQKKSKKDNIIGADQGIKKVLVLSDGQMTTSCPHGHDFTSIIKSLSRKKKGSKSFLKAQAHRKNYIHWSLNQLDLSGIQELRLEKIHQMRTGKRTSRFLAHFTYTTTKQKLISLCKQNGVRFVEVPNRYRSQRCFECGFVHKQNRKLESYECSSCGTCEDADLNAAKNISLDLCTIPSFVSNEKLNHSTGFYWLEKSVIRCSDITVPDVN